MRYADGPTAEVEVVVHAPLERVWALVTDIELPARFSSEFRGAEWIDDGPAVDARFRGRNEHAAIGTWETTCVVTRCEPPAGVRVGGRRRRRRVGGVALRARAGRRRRAVCGSGAASVRRPSGLTPAILAMPDKEERIVARRLEEFRANMQATLDGIKQLAEEAP